MTTLRYLIGIGLEKVRKTMKISVMTVTSSLGRDSNQTPPEWKSESVSLGKYLILSFRRVLNVICPFLGNSPASEF